jgi:hypothetical protein
MFEIPGLFAFSGAAYVYAAVIIAIDVFLIYLNRTFFKKI